MRARHQGIGTGDGVKLPAGLPYPPGEVTAENYAERAVSFMRASGRVNGEHPVIRAGVHTIAWPAWLAFFAEIGVPHARLRQAGYATVPAMLPWEFSADADHLHRRFG